MYVFQCYGHRNQYPLFIVLYIYPLLCSALLSSPFLFVSSSLSLFLGAALIAIHARYRVNLVGRSGPGDYLYPQSSVFLSVSSSLFFVFCVFYWLSVCQSVCVCAYVCLSGCQANWVIDWLFASITVYLSIYLSCGPIGRYENMPTACFFFFLFFFSSFHFFIFFIFRCEGWRCPFGSN